ncbi:ankyrin repeat-containing domain protein, partial [Mycena olivaceomarginata]
ELVDLLLHKGANVNAQVGKHGTALQIAFDRQEWEVVELLIQNGADVNVEGGVFSPPRWRAWIANLEVKGGDYGTAIQAASYYGCLEIVKLLLNNGADVHAQGRPFPLAM